MKNIELYTLSTCPWCAKTKKFLKENNIDFKFIDYDLADKEVQIRITKEMKASGKNVAFPYLKIDEEVVVGWNPTKYKELLEIDG